MVFQEGPLFINMKDKPSADTRIIPFQTELEDYIFRLYDVESKGAIDFQVIIVEAFMVFKFSRKK